MEIKLYDIDIVEVIDKINKPIRIRAIYLQQNKRIIYIFKNVYSYNLETKTEISPTEGLKGRYDLFLQIEDFKQIEFKEEYIKSPLEIALHKLGIIVRTPNGDLLPIIDIGVQVTALLNKEQN